MRKIYLLICFIILLSLFISVQANEKYTYLDVTLLNQDPYPAQPDNYVDLIFKIENEGGSEAEDVLVELLPEYPFSLDPGVSAIKRIGLIRGSQYGAEAVFVKYRVRVDKDAIDGENGIKLRYIYNTEGIWDKFFEKEFDIMIDDPKTDFDIAIQDYSSETNSLTIAISNIGEQDANSVTIILPEQSSIDIIGSDREIVGGIDADDYTVSSFRVIPREDAALIVRIAYTDSIGVRREVEKAVIFHASKYEKEADKGAVTDYRALIYIAIGVIGIIIIFVLLRILRKKRKK
ncbi:MAG: hypothetical protein IB618_03515 [Candidatus Pacearchaeota archaeon]|nr:MAG: hypothetical protein IB618_03515 [Candidatus Pacearchaeota archaeon]